VCVVALRKAVELCNNGIGEVQHRLATKERLSLYGSIAGAIGGASVVGLLAAEHGSIGIAAGGIAFIGSLVTLVSDHFGKVPDHGSSLSEMYRQLEMYRQFIESIVEADWIANELQVYLEYDTKGRDAAVSRLIGKGNECSRGIYRVLGTVGLSANLTCHQPLLSEKE